MPEWITQLDALGVVVVFALYIIGKELGWIKNRKVESSVDVKHSENQRAITDLIQAIKDIKGVQYGIKGHVEDLHKWHDVRDTDGVPKWYIKESMEDTMKILAESIKIQTESTKDLSMNIKLEGQVLTQLVEEIRDLKTVVSTKG